MNVIVQPGSRGVVLRVLRPHYLRAQVKGSDGNPLKQVKVGRISYLTPGGQLTMELVFGFSGRVELSAEGHRTVGRDLSWSIHEDVELGELNFERGRTVVVAVIGEDGAPVERPAFATAGPEQLASARQGDGWQLRVDEGPVQLDVTADHYRGASTTIAPEVTSHSVVMSHGSKVTGVVRDPLGHPLAPDEYTVQVRGCGSKDRKVGDQGRFVLHGLASGKCRARVFRLGKMAWGSETSFVLPENGSVSIELVAP